MKLATAYIAGRFTFKLYAGLGLLLFILLDYEHAIAILTGLGMLIFQGIADVVWLITNSLFTIMKVFVLGILYIALAIVQSLLNVVIEAINNVPGVDIEKLNFASTLKDMIDQAIHNLINDSIVEATKEHFNENFEEIAENLDEYDPLYTIKQLA